MTEEYKQIEEREKNLERDKDDLWYRYRHKTIVHSYMYTDYRNNLTTIAIGS